MWAFERIEFKTSKYGCRHTFLIRTLRTLPIVFLHNHKNPRFPKRIYMSNLYRHLYSFHILCGFVSASPVSNLFCGSFEAKNYILSASYRDIPSKQITNLKFPSLIIFVELSKFILLLPRLYTTEPLSCSRNMNPKVQTRALLWSWRIPLRWSPFITRFVNQTNHVFISTLLRVYKNLCDRKSLFGSYIIMKFLKIHR